MRTNAVRTNGHTHSPTPNPTPNNLSLAQHCSPPELSPQIYRTHFIPKMFKPASVRVASTVSRPSRHSRDARIPNKRVCIAQITLKRCFRCSHHRQTETPSCLSEPCKADRSRSWRCSRRRSYHTQTSSTNCTR